MRLSDAGLRRHPTKLLYPNHRPPPWLTEDASPRDRSNRLLGSSSAPYSGDPPFASANLDQLPSNEQLRRQVDASSVACADWLPMAVLASSPPCQRASRL